MARELRHDGAAAKDGRLRLHGLNRAWVKLAKQTGVLPSRVRHGFGEDELSHPVQRDRYCAMLWGSPSRMVGIRDGAELVDDGVPPESLGVTNGGRRGGRTLAASYR